MMQEEIFREFAAYGVASSEVLALDHVDHTTFGYQEQCQIYLH